MSQLHKRFSADELKKLFDRYLQKEVKRKGVALVALPWGQA
jgi:hypothetical protein